LLEADCTQPSFEAFREELDGAIAGILEINSELASNLYAHFRLLLSWNRVVNLTSVTHLREAVRTHYCESLFLAARLPAGSLDILDVGSGAGFPGIPIAAARPNCRVVLAERRRRKAAFLKEATRGWPNVHVFAGDAEELSQEFDWVVSRAVRPEAVVELAARKAGWVGLLTSSDGAERVANRPDFRWQAPVVLPWGQRRVLLFGQALATGW